MHNMKVNGNSIFAVVQDKNIDVFLDIVPLTVRIQSILVSTFWNEFITTTTSHSLCCNDYCSSIITNPPSAWDHTSNSLFSTPEA